MKRLLLIGMLAAWTVRAEEIPRYTYEVEHGHLTGGCQGTVKIFESGIWFDSDESKDTRHWTYADIRKLATDGPYRVTIVSREGGGEKAYKFNLQGRGFAEAANEYVQAKLRSDLPPAAATGGDSWTLVVQHEHVIGSCNGKLIVTAQGLDFQSEEPKDARQFKYTEISKVQTDGPYVLKVWSYESDAKKLGADKLYTFSVTGAGVSEKCLDFIRSHMRSK